jgi:Family of unknown function (DUF5333)
MSGLWPRYRPAAGCYGMSGRFGPDLGLPQLSRNRNPAARTSAKGQPAMSKYRFSLLIAAFLAAASLPALAEGKVALAEEAHINEQLIAGAAGDILRKTCPTLSARMLVVWSKLNALEAYARAQGYTEDEVKVFLKDKAQKARVKAAALEYLVAAGAVEGDVESFCAAGRAEIAGGTLVGSLLWSSQ